MTNFSQLPESHRQQNIDHINQRWSQLYHLQKEWADKAVNFLFLTNSGGAIAMLSFIGTREDVHCLVKIGLALMLIGIILVGVLVARSYHLMTGLFDAYRTDVKEYFADRISQEKLNEDDSKRSKDSKWDLILGYGSFGCFILGISLGIYGLFL